MDNVEDDGLDVALNCSLCITILLCFLVVVLFHFFSYTYIRNEKCSGQVIDVQPLFGLGTVSADYVAAVEVDGQEYRVALPSKGYEAIKAGDEVQVKFSYSKRGELKDIAITKQ